MSGFRKAYWMLIPVVLVIISGLLLASLRALPVQSAGALQETPPAAAPPKPAGGSAVDANATPAPALAASSAQADAVQQESASSPEELLSQIAVLQAPPADMRPFAAADAAAPADTHSELCKVGFCWNRVRYIVSSCWIDQSKGTLNFDVSFPVYRWEVPGQDGIAQLKVRLWIWTQAGGWINAGWTALSVQQVGTGQYIFDDNVYRYGPDGLLDINYLASRIGFSDLHYSRALPGIIGLPYTFAVEWRAELGDIPGYPFPFLVQGGYIPFGRPDNVLCVHPGLGGQAQTGGAALPSALSESAAIAPSLPPGARSNLNLPLVVGPKTSAARATPTPTATLVAQLPPTPSGPATTGNMRNANFDANAALDAATVSDTGWTVYSSRNFPIVMPGPKGFAARSGTKLAWLGGVISETSSISQTLIVPTSHPYLSLYLMASSNEEDCNYDTAAIMLNDSQIATIRLCQAANFHSWLRTQIDMKAFAGKQVTLTIKVQNDVSLISHLFVDDLTWESGVVVPTPAPTLLATPTPTRTPTPAPSGGVILNPGFELGDTGDWPSATRSGTRNIFLHQGAHSGRWLAWLGDIDNEVGYIEQTLYIPHDRPYFTYWGWISSNESVCGGDKVTFHVGAAKVFEYNLCTAYNSRSWGQGWLNLKAYSGTTQTVRISIQTNSALRSSLYMDDFAWASSAPTAADANVAAAADDHVGPGTAGDGSAPAAVPNRDGESMEVSP